MRKFFAKNILKKNEEENVEKEVEKKVEDKKMDEEETQVQEDSLGFFTRLKNGLSKTRKGITEKVDQIISQYQGIDEELYEEIEEVLITADIGMNTTIQIIDNLKMSARKNKVNDPQELRELLKEIIHEILKEDDEELHIQEPCVFLVIGVNGVGKTTSIGKLAAQFKAQGKSVLLGAGDTFRAAAVEQLDVWANRVGVDIIKHQQGSDPAAVIYDAIQAAKARKTDILICDTAGRLHNKKNLMNELEKINRIISKEYPESNRYTFLVLDATTGQNAVSQAKLFSEVADVNGLILTKLDGTSKGGVVLAIKSQLNIPVKYIGVGEGVRDLQPFHSKQFIDALFE